MLKSAKSFLNIPIVSLYNTAKVGLLLDFVIDPSAGKVIGIVGEKSGYIKKRNKVVSVVDIREISPKALIIDNENALVWQDEIVRIDDILKSKIKIFNSKVITESGKYLGRVDDFLVDDFFYLSKLYVRPVLTNIFTTQIIIPRDLVLRVTKDGVIVSDDVLGLSTDKEIVGAT